MTEEQREKRREENKALKLYLRGTRPTISPDDSTAMFIDGSMYKLGLNKKGRPAGFIKVKGRDE